MRVGGAFWTVRVRECVDRIPSCADRELDVSSHDRREPQPSVTENAGNYCVQVTLTTSAVEGNGHPPLAIRRQAGGDTRRGHAEHVVDVLETRVRKIVEIHQAVRKSEMP